MPSQKQPYIKVKEFTEPQVEKVADWRTARLVERFLSRLVPTGNDEKKLSVSRIRASLK